MDKEIKVYDYGGSGVEVKVATYGTPGIIWIGSSSYCLVSDDLGSYRTRSDRRVSIASVSSIGEIRRILQPWDPESDGLAKRFKVTRSG